MGMTAVGATVAAVTVAGAAVLFYHRGARGAFRLMDVRLVVAGAHLNGIHQAECHPPLAITVVEV